MSRRELCVDSERAVVERADNGWVIDGCAEPGRLPEHRYVARTPGELIEALRSLGVVGADDEVGE